VVNYMEPFRRFVVNDFVHNYARGLTPNPCVLCNQVMKFDLLLRRARALGADLLATGHYARIVKHEGDGLLYIAKAADRSKDQSYFLFGLGQEELSRLVMPLGDFTKDEVRRMARRFGLPVAEKKESQEVCFVQGGDYRGFLAEHGGIGRRSGPIVDMEGNVLGRHDGVHAFTVGQRRGLGLGGGGRKLYVVRIDPAADTVYVGEEKDLLARGVVARGVRWTGEPPAAGTVVEAKIRYRHPGSPSRLKPLDGGRVEVLFSAPQRAAAPGQAVVFYDGDRVLGGGWIEEVYGR